MSSKTPFSVLICDDDKSIRAVTCIILKRIGYKTSSCESGEELLEMVSESKPDIVLLDIKLPGMTGDEVAKTLKKQEATCDIPVILFSAANDIENLAKNAGADSFLQKPFDIARLEQKISSLLVRAFPGTSFA